MSRNRQTDNIDVCCLVLYVYVTSACICSQIRNLVNGSRDEEALVTAWCLRRNFSYLNALFFIPRNQWLIRELFSFFSPLSPCSLALGSSNDWQSREAGIFSC